MKISKVTANARKREVEIEAGEHKYAFPYAKLRTVPTTDDPITEIGADDDFGGEAFTYRLESGVEDTVHLDAVLEVNLDADYLQEVLLHRLTVEARNGLGEAGIGIRQAARMLGTSPAQLYRLLDPGNSGKSLGQLLALLHLVNRHVEVVVAPCRIATLECDDNPRPRNIRSEGSPGGQGATR